MAGTVRDVMTKDPIMLTDGASVLEAARSMRDSDIGDVIVLDSSDQVCGIVTDRDVVVRVIAEGKDPSSTKLGEMCSRQLETVSPDDSIGDAVRHMTDKAVRRLPVIEDGKPIGIVSLGDLAIEQDRQSALADISKAPPNN